MLVIKEYIIVIILNLKLSYITMLIKSVHRGTKPQSQLINCYNYLIKCGQQSNYSRLCAVAMAQSD